MLKPQRHLLLRLLEPPLHRLLLRLLQLRRLPLLLRHQLVDLPRPRKQVRPPALSLKMPLQRLLKLRPTARALCTSYRTHT